MPAGRPPAIKSPLELDAAIDDYYLKCQESEEPFTIIGLAVHMGISKDTIIEYGKNPEFSDSYKKAMALAEKSLVHNALTGGYNPTVSIFLLKNNHGYRDKQEIASTIEATMTDKTLTDNEVEEEMRKRGLPLDIIGH